LAFLEKLSNRILEGAGVPVKPEGRSLKNWEEVPLQLLNFVSLKN
jgi:hypothetical protein